MLLEFVTQRLGDCSLFAKKYIHDSNPNKSNHLDINSISFEISISHGEPDARGVAPECV